MKALYTNKSKLNRDKMNQNIFSVGFLAVSALVIASILVATPVSTPVISTGGLAYNSHVCADVTRTDGAVENAGCSSNFFSTAGRNAVMDLLSYDFTSDPFTVIAICNGTNSNGGVQCYVDSGLSNGTGTVLTNVGGTAGNWSISKQFTSTADNKATNSTALFNATNAGSTYFAGNNFTAVTLNNGDSITIRWNISIS